jgi:hypothetical protein
MASKRARSPSRPEDAPPAKRSDSGLLNTNLNGNARTPASSHTLSITSSNTALAEASTAVQHPSQDPGALAAAPTPMALADEFRAVHDSWEAFEEALKEYAQRTYQLYVTRSTTSVKRRNLKIAESAAKGDAARKRPDGLDAVEQVTERALIPEQLLWYSKSLKCTHGWKDRHRGTGKRGSGVVRSTSCPAKMCVTLQHRGAGLEDWKVVVTKHVRTHNHQLSKELYLYYTENRRIYDPELLGVAGDSPGAVQPAADMTNAQISSLIEQANQNQRSGLYRILTSGDVQSQHQLQSMAFMTPDSASQAAVPSGAASDGRTSKQLVPLVDANSGHFVIRPRPTTGTALAGMPPMGTMILAAGTVPSRPMDGGGFCVPRVALKVHATWDAFHDYIAQYSFDTAQIFRTRSTVSVSSRNAKTLASIAAKASGDGHEVASYASFAAASPASRLIPEEYKWFSKLLICTYGWKSRARGKRSRLGEVGASGPCPAMLLARVERNVEGRWHVVINRQVPEHSHRLNGHVEEADPPSFEASDSLDASPTVESTPPHQSASADSSSVVGNEASVVAPSLNRREIVVRVPKLQSVFKSWDEFHASLKAYSDVTYQLYRTRTTSSAQGRNKKIAQMKRDGSDAENGARSDDPDASLSGVAAPRKIPESWRWYSKTLTCTHGWKERSRGTGKRSAHGVRSTACPVKICATVQFVNPPYGQADATAGSSTDENCWRVVVTKHIVDHNHNLSRELYQHYCENRRIYDPELLAIDSSSEGTIVRQKTCQAAVTEANSMHSAQDTGAHAAAQPSTSPSQLPAGLAEVVNRVQLFDTPGSSQPIGSATSGSITVQQAVAGVATTVGVSQQAQAVPSVVLLPYNTPASYLPGQAQSHAQGQQTGTGYADTSGAHLGPAMPGLTHANVLLLNNTGMATSGALAASGSNVISVACRVHGSSSGASSAGGQGQAGPASNAAASTNAQCTCFRIAGGGNYVTIAPVGEPLGQVDSSFDPDDESMLYAEDVDGVWHPSSSVGIEKVPSENGEATWRVPRIMRRHPTWEAFHKYMDLYSAATFQLYRVRTTYSVRSRNARLRQLAANRGLTVREGETGEAEQESAQGLSRAHLVPEQYEWYSKTFLCTHGWKRRSRGSGQRMSHNVRATECPAKVCATLQRTNGATSWSVVVTKHVPEHNHEISETIYHQYSEVRRVRDPQVLAQAEQMWRAGATRRRVFEFLKERSPNNTILMKDVHNLVQRWQSQERRPAQNEELGDRAERLDGEGQQPAAVSAAHSEENEPWL